MKVSELTPEQRAELQKRYKEAGLKGPIHLLTVEKVEEKINASALVIKESQEEELTFDVDVFKPVIKINEEGKEYQAQESTRLEFKENNLIIEIGGKIPAGQSFNHPKNSFIVKIESEQFIISAELAAKIFKLKG